MAHFFAPAQADVSNLDGRTVAVLGYGNQGRSHALNLRDSGIDVHVGARPGHAGWRAASEDGFSPLKIQDTADADLVMLALSDVPMAEVFREDIQPALRAGQMLLFCHGFNLRYGLILPPANCDVAVVSPKGSGHSLRKAFVSGNTLPCLVALHQDATGTAIPKALAYAKAIGCGQLMVESTVAEETETDLFGEQVVLCGGLMELVDAAFGTLLEAGYQPEAAFFECVYEAKLIVDLLMARGPDGMQKAISDTAEWGGYLAGRQVITEESRAAMRRLLNEIRSGRFAQEWRAETDQGSPRLKAERTAREGGRLNQVWAELKARDLP